MSEATLTILFQSDGGYTVSLEGELRQIEEACTMISIESLVGKLTQTILQNAIKEASWNMENEA